MVYEPPARLPVKGYRGAYLIRSAVMYTRYRRVFCYTTATGAFCYLWWRSTGSLFTVTSAQSKDHSQYNKETLDKNAVLRNLTHPIISSVHVNSLASNK